MVRRSPFADHQVSGEPAVGANLQLTHAARDFDREVVVDGAQGEG